MTTDTEPVIQMGIEVSEVSGIEIARSPKRAVSVPTKAAVFASVLAATWIGTSVGRIAPSSAGWLSVVGVVLFVLATAAQLTTHAHTWAAKVDRSRARVELSTAITECKRAEFKNDTAGAVVASRNLEDAKRWLAMAEARVSEFEV